MDDRTIWDSLDRSSQLELQNAFPILKNRRLNGA